MLFLLIAQHCEFIRAHACSQATQDCINAAFGIDNEQLLEAPTGTVSASWLLLPNPVYPSVYYKAPAL